ncbi:MAG: ATP phosphoribosyltransferase [Myxococcales bacterium]|nr:ATP phosphoribosyltransferase [Myxococcales bacterium]
MAAAGKSSPRRAGPGDLLTLALPKGRILQEAAALLAKAGYDVSPALGESRELQFVCGPLRVLVVRSSDVITYVSRGAADLGVAGSDVLEEAGVDMYAPLCLGIGRCDMVVAARADEQTRPTSMQLIRVGTKYPRTAAKYYDSRGLAADIIELSGSIELGPWTGLCDQIVDITQSGETLRQNHLTIVDKVGPVASMLVVNRAAMKLRHAEISTMVARLRDHVQAPVV